MSKHSDVIVIGGGITGCAAAYFLSSDGLDVTLIEKDKPAAHASGFAFGLVSPSFRASDNASAVERLLSISVNLHHWFARSLHQESGVEYESRLKAGLHLALNDADVARLKPAGVAAYRSNEWHKERQDIRWMAYGELSHVEARISTDVIGALYIGGQLEVSPSQLTEALWKAAEAKGAKMLNAAAEEIRAQCGKVEGVETTDGLYTADIVILAAGPWCERILMSGFDTSYLTLPVAPLKGEILRFDIGEQPAMPVSLWWDSDYASCKPDGLLYAGTTEEDAGFDEQPTESGRNKIIDSVVDVLPFVKDAKVAKQTACLRPVSSDGLPIVGDIDGIEGLVVATAGGRSGIELGPGIGKVAAEFAVGNRAIVSNLFKNLSPNRFK